MSIGLGAYGSFWIIACVARWLARLLVWPSCNGGPAAWVILPTSFLAGASAVSCFSCAARWLIGLLVSTRFYGCGEGSGERRAWFVCGARGAPYLLQKQIGQIGKQLPTRVSDCG